MSLLMILSILMCINAIFNIVLVFVRWNILGYFNDDMGYIISVMVNSVSYRHIKGELKYERF